MSASSDPSEPDEGLVRRPVRSADDSLSREANDLLTGELREVIGADEVDVPVDKPDHTHDRHATHGPVAAPAASNRLAIGLPLIVLVIVGAIVSLATGSWWFLVLAVAVHAVGTVVILAGFLHLAAEAEHVAPTTAARLEDEGVADPDRVFTELLAEFADAAPGDGDEVRSHSSDSGRRSQEDRTAMTPASGPTTAIDGGAMHVPRLMVVASAVLGIVAAIVVGGAMWAAAAVLVLCLVGWLVFTRTIQAERRDHRDVLHRRLPLVFAGLVGVITIGTLVVVALTYA